MMAGRAADAGVVVNAAYVYGNSITFRDITVGNNGASCLVGFDLCSGLGSWIGCNSIRELNLFVLNNIQTASPMLGRQLLLWIKIALYGREPPV